MQGTRSRPTFHSWSVKNNRSEFHGISHMQAPHRKPVIAITARHLAKPWDILQELLSGFAASPLMGK
jgi:hypothetical protein